MLFVPGKPQEARLSGIHYVTPTSWPHRQIKIMMKMWIMILESTSQEQVLVIPVCGGGGGGTEINVKKKT